MALKRKTGRLRVYVWTTAQHDVVETVITVVGALGAGWLFIYRRVERMISKQVNLRVSEMAQQISNDTAKQLEHLRDEIHTTLVENRSSTQQETHALSERLDKLMQALIK